MTFNLLSMGLVYSIILSMKSYFVHIMSSAMRVVISTTALPRCPLQACVPCTYMLQAHCTRPVFHYCSHQIITLLGSYTSTAERTALYVVLALPH